MKKLGLILFGICFYSGNVYAANGITMEYIRCVRENSVPQPASGTLLLIGLLGIWWKATRKSSTNIF
ncbi:MAG: hypothetical protein HQL26_10885 [Candidatus Omnitrophica bacterium]|nr:hypothetical protein [Candidatus Omnitrophota bacterium]